jgi:Mce-associated membrane protein
VTPTWYDLLGVEPTASADEIRAAWKAAIADLEPGDRRFRTLNEAAEVLLDADRRATYDATLQPDALVAPVAEERGAPAPSLEAPDLTAPHAITDLPSEKARARAEAKERRAQAKQERQVSASTPRRTIPAWLLTLLALLTALAVAAAGYLYSQPSDDSIASATSQAQGAAERAATTILAYDYRHLDDDKTAAGELMTSSYRKKYDELFAQIAANAPSLKVSVTVQVVASGIVRSGDDRVQVLVFVNRPTTRADTTEPKIYRDQVVMTMVKQGGDWLVDDMNTNQLAS